MKKRNGKRAIKKRNKKALERYIKFMMPLYDLSNGSWDDEGYFTPYYLQDPQIVNPSGYSDRTLFLSDVDL